MTPNAPEISEIDTDVLPDSITEVEIATDGRIFLFGASPQFLELLRACGLSNDELVASRLATETNGLDNPRVHHMNSDQS